MPIKISDSIKSYSRYKDKLFHPRKTIMNAVIALRKLKPPILVRFKRIDYLDRLNVPVYICKTNKIIEKLYPADSIFRHKSYGKGKSLIQSKASAIMEILERFSCYFFFKNDNNFLITTCGRIKNKMVLKNLLLSLPKEFRKDTFICNELEKSPFKWVRSFSLTQNKDILFPINWFVNSTTGFASGNCIEEAILQGICEFIERHQITIITEKKLTLPLIDIKSIDNIDAKNIISKFNHAGIKLFIKDFSYGFEISTIGILAYDSKGPKPIKILCAAGTSLNKNIAMIRALTEIAQHRSQGLFQKALHFQTFGFPSYKCLKDAEYLINSKRIINFADLPTYSNKNFRVEVETAVKKLKNKGLEIIVTDVTHPIIKIPTVIITIPGIKISSMYGNPFLELSEYYAEINNYYKSINILKFFFKFYPSSKKRIHLLLIYGSQYEKLRKFNQAIKIYKIIASLISNKDNKAILIEAYKALIRCYLNLKKADKVDAIFQKLKNILKDN